MVEETTLAAPEHVCTLEATVTKKNVFSLYASDVWGNVSSVRGFKKRGPVTTLKDGTMTRFTVALEYDDVWCTFEHRFSPTRIDTVQIRFEPSELRPTQYGRYRVRIIRSDAVVFQGHGVYTSGVQEILYAFHVVTKRRLLENH